MSADCRRQMLKGTVGSVSEVYFYELKEVDSILNRVGLQKKISSYETPRNSEIFLACAIVIKSGLFSNLLYV